MMQNGAAEGDGTGAGPAPHTIEPQTPLRSCVIVAVTFLILWILVAPGPRNEEMFLVGLFSLPIAICALVAAIFDPRPVSATLVFSGIFLAGLIGTSLRVSFAYDYPLYHPESVRITCQATLVAVLAVGTLNVASLLARRAWRRWFKP